MTKVWENKDASNLILKDGERQRVPMMQRDSSPAGFCHECQGRGVWKVVDQNLTCPYCSGSGMVSATGGPVEKVVRNTANETEGARGGEFGNDHATLSDAQMLDRYLAKDAAWRRLDGGQQKRLENNGCRESTSRTDGGRVFQAR